MLTLAVNDNRDLLRRHFASVRQVAGQETLRELPLASLVEDKGD